MVTKRLSDRICRENAYQKPTSVTTANIYDNDVLTLELGNNLLSAIKQEWLDNVTSDEHYNSLDKSDQIVLDTFRKEGFESFARKIAPYGVNMIIEGDAFWDVLANEQEENDDDPED